MTDIVKRLRDLSNLSGKRFGKTTLAEAAALIEEQAKEIERLVSDRLVLSDALAKAQLKITGNKLSFVVSNDLVALLESNLTVAREALEFYGAKKHWKSVTIEDTNRRFCIFTGADLEYFEHEDQNSFCGKRARKVLEEMK